MLDALIFLWALSCIRRIDLLTGACVVSSLQLAQSVLFPPAPRVGKLGNDLASEGKARRKEEPRGVFWRKRSLVLFCSFRKHLRHKPVKYLV